MTTQTDWREFTQRGMDRIRNMPPVPYREGRPAGRVIVVAGRRTGLPRPFGINVIQVGGRLYVCSATRRRDWVRNLVAAGRCTVERDGPGGAGAEYAAVLIEGAEAGRALAAYLSQIWYHDPDLPFAAGATAEEITPHTTSTTVIRLDPLT
jgi:deazaflavin-dependent oxidoreductase (nitroreductase family)